MLRRLSDILACAALQRALIDLDACRLGSADERATAYARAGLKAGDLDAEAYSTERLRRRVAAPGLSFRRAA